MKKIARHYADCGEREIMVVKFAGGVRLVCKCGQVLVEEGA